MVKNLSTNAGDIRDAGLIPGREDPLEAKCRHCGQNEESWKASLCRLKIIL